MTTIRVIGLGQPLGGDDAIGLEVVRRLRAEGAQPGLELMEVAEPSRLVPLLGGADRVILVDAALGGDDPGRVRTFEAEELPRLSGRLLSTHGVGVVEALELMRVLAPEAKGQRITIVAVAISGTLRRGEKLSPEVAAAVPVAVRAVQDLIAADPDPEKGRAP
jgi:hydrogenase maturation protease